MLWRRAIGSSRALFAQPSYRISNARNNGAANSSSLEDAIHLATEFPGDFTLQYPPRREYYKELYRTTGEPQFAHETVQDPRASPDDGYHRQVMLYFHVPFCEHKCFYCNFAVDTRGNNELHEIYVDRLIEGIGHLSPLYLGADPLQLQGIDIGGGTPTLLKADTLKRLLQAIRPLRDASLHSHPLSIETTPNIASSHMDRLVALKEGGVDRISMGLQSTDAELLRQMNRGKEACVSSRAVENIQKAGFARFSVDVIFGLPGQTLEHWRNDLQRVVDLGINTVTTYDCLYRGKGRAMTRGNSRPTAEDYGELYDYGYEFLTEHGYRAPYGSVNFSKHEGETGTSAYFEGRLLDGLQFLGIGNYASSVMDDKWWFAPYSVDQWLESTTVSTAAQSDWDTVGQFLPMGDCYTLPMEERAAKYLLLSLSFGIIDPARFARVFREDIHVRFSASLHLAISQGWLRWDAAAGYYTIPKGQFKNIGKLRSLFYSLDAIKWLQNIRDHPQDQFRHRIIQKARLARAASSQ